MRARECRSASVVVSQRAEPGPLGAEGEARGDLLAAADAPGGQDGQRGDGLDDLRDQDHGGDVAGVAARLVALGDDDVDARLRVAAGVLGAAREGGDEDPVFVGAGDDVGGRGTEGVRQEFDGVVEGDVELAPGDLFHPAGDPPAGGLTFRQFGHVVFGEGVADEGAVRRRDHRLDVRLADAVDRLLGGHDHVEPVGLAVGVLLHPVEIAPEVVGGGVADGAEDAESTRAGDGRGDRREGREAEDGVFDSQFPAQLRLHGGEDAAGHRPREEVF